MDLFKTTPQQQLRVSQIATAMRDAGLKSPFVADCVSLANEYEGAHDLMVLWAEAKSQTEKDDVVRDLHAEIASHKSAVTD